MEKCQKKKKTWNRFTSARIYPMTNLTYEIWGHYYKLITRCLVKLWFNALNRQMDQIKKFMDG